MHNCISALLLTKLNTGRNSFRFSELGGLDKDSSFDAGREVRALIKEGYIRDEGAGRYRITIDIGTLRKLVLKGEEGDEQPSPPPAALSKYDIINSVWHISGPDSDDREVKECKADERSIFEKRKAGDNDFLTRLFDDETSSSGDDDDLFADFDDDDGLFTEPEDNDDAAEKLSGGSHIFGNPAGGRYTMHDRMLAMHLRAMLASDSSRDKLSVAMLKLCASEDNVTFKKICSSLGISSKDCISISNELLWRGFLEKKGSYYVLAMSESLFFKCCEEAKNGTSVQSAAEDTAEVQESGGDDAALGEGDVNESLLALLRTDLTMTRAKAITKAEGCLFAATEGHNKAAMLAYLKMLNALNNMSDYMFNQLKRKLQD